jgi:hypothetical protein
VFSPLPECQSSCPERADPPGSPEPALRPFYFLADLYSSTNIFNIQQERSTSHTICVLDLLWSFSLHFSNCTILHKVLVRNSEPVFINI